MFNKFSYLLDTDLSMLECTFYNVTRIAIIGNGILNDDGILNKVIDIIHFNDLDIFNIDVSESKISVIFKNTVSNSILEQFHKELVEQ